jgi:hypothetical protein
VCCFDFNGSSSRIRPAFPFLELPKEIRKIIYEYWIEPFRNPAYNGFIKFKVGVVYNRRCHPFRNGYDMRVPVDVKPKKKKYKHIHKEDDEDNNQQGSQEGNERSEAPWPPQQERHRHLKRQDYETIWSLSKVSHQIRSELGTTFWNKIYLDIDHWEYLLLDFLQDRPAVCRSIKKLRMSWPCNNGPSDLDDTIIDFCSYVSQQLVLDELIFSFSTSPDIARQVLASEGNMAWIKAFKTINARKLTVELDLCDDTDEQELWYRLQDEMNPKMEKLLRPMATGVGPGEVTDKDAYLLSRAS